MLRNFSRSHLEAWYSRDFQIQSMIYILIKLKENIFCQKLFAFRNQQKIVQAASLRFPYAILQNIRASRSQKYQTSPEM